MQLPLDILLFWAGLGLLSVGIFVFVTGKSSSEEKKRQSNRFEAFGIKIDVNNPSLILIILGVVMMLAPKLMPQSPAELEQPQANDDTSTPAPDTQMPKSSFVQSETKPQEVVDPLNQSSRPQQPEPEPNPTILAVVEPTVRQMPEVATIQDELSILTVNIEKPAAAVMAKKPGPAVTHLESPKVPDKAVSKPTPAPVVSKLKTTPTVSTTIRPTAPVTPKVAVLPKRTIPAKTVKKPVVRTIAKKPQPAVTQQQPVKAPAIINIPAPPPPPAKPNLIVLVQADVDSRAGIEGSAEAYNEQISAELVTLAEEMFGDKMNIKQQTIKALRRVLKQEATPYQTLCKRTDAERLLVADLEVPFALSNVTSAFWPDLELHLANCDTGRKQRRVKTHLSPTAMDHFPFQRAIREFTTDFVVDFRHLVVN